jgi:hypothetical protein
MQDRQSAGIDLLLLGLSLFLHLSRTVLLSP